VILYRCSMPTNWLCRCGTVARRLNKLGIEHEELRVPQRRSQRAEIDELTDQRWVPVLVDGEDVIHESHRILEYLSYRDGSRDPSAPTD
jgi:glutathione S-transferase